MNANAAVVLDGTVESVIVVADPSFTIEGRSVVVLPEGSPVSAGWTYKSGTFQPPPVSPPDPNVIAALVDAERDRRIAAGFTYQGERFQSRPQDQDNIRDAYLRALATIGRGEGQMGDVMWYGASQPFGWIAEDNSVMALDAPGMVDLGNALGDRKKNLTFAGFAIKERLRLGEVIPDITADALWPT